MDGDRFDALSRTLSATRSRRNALRALLGTVLGSGSLEFLADGAAADKQ